MPYQLVLKLMLIGALGGTQPSEKAASDRVNPRPATVPALRQWSGHTGTLTLARRVRILVAERDWDRLRGQATLLASELRVLTRRPVWAIQASGRVTARTGDIVLALRRPDPELGNEGYTIAVARVVTITAPRAAGVFYGTRTLLQLEHQRRELPRGTARDWPRYPVRGLMIDLGRRVYPASWVEGEIERLAYLKMNILHLHLTDDQRWGIESVTHPEIVSPHALSKRELEHILAVARRYQVTVVPEIDMPGHLGALLAHHPSLELGAAKLAIPPHNPQSSKLDISNPAALNMVGQLLDEYLSLFPGRYWDAGGDEYLSSGQQRLYPELATYAVTHYGPRATTQDAVIGFLNWVDRFVRRHHKVLWAWHDELGGGNAVSARADIQAGWWTGISPLSQLQPLTPHQLLSAGHEIVNEGWFPTYYTESVGSIEGKPSLRAAYENWDVNQFCSPTVGGRFVVPCYFISPRASGNLGSTINAWDDHELSLTELASGLWSRLTVLAQKAWHSPPLTTSYASFQRIVHAVGDG